MKKRIPMKWLVAAGLALALAAGVLAVFWPSRGAAPDAPPDGDEQGLVAAARRASRPKKGAAPRPKQAQPAPDGNGKKEGGRGGTLSDDLQEALDSEDFDRTREVAVKAYQSYLPEVRMQAVEALGWFGKKALVDLVPMMCDRDKEVAKAAADAWEAALMEVEDANFRFLAAQDALKTISGPDVLAMIGAQFSSAASELIDGADDEKTASRRRVQAVQALVDMMGAGGDAPRATVARELYEELTGYPWAGVDEAERYLAHPDDYEPPEQP